VGTSWTIETQSDESDDWTVDNLDSLNSSAEKESWILTPISSNASGRSKAIGWGNWVAEEFNFTPEDVDIAPEQVQADREQWTIVPEAS